MIDWVILQGLITPIAAGLLIGIERGGTGALSAQDRASLACEHLRFSALRADCSPSWSLGYRPTQWQLKNAVDGTGLLDNGLVQIDFEIRNACEPFLHQDPHFKSGEVGAGAAVGTPPERRGLSERAIEMNLIGMFELAIVEAVKAVGNHDDLARSDCDAV